MTVRWSLTLLALFGLALLLAACTTTGSSLLFVSYPDDSYRRMLSSSGQACRS